MVPLILGNPKSTLNPHIGAYSESDFRRPFSEVLPWASGFRVTVPLKQIEYGVYGDLIIICPKPYSIYLPGDCRGQGLRLRNIQVEGLENRVHVAGGFYGGRSTLRVQGPK